MTPCGPGDADALEALWELPRATPPERGLPARLTAFAVHVAGGPTPALLLEQARVKLELLHDGDAIDVWEHLSGREELDELERREAR